MSQLTRADAVNLLAFVGEAQTVAASEAFTTELLDRLAAVMSCDFATYYRLDPSHEVARTYVPCTHEADYPPVASSEWSVDVKAAEPTRRHLVRTWSDVYTKDVRSRFEVVGWASVFGVVDCAWTMFSGEHPEQSAVLLHRQERDFSEHDRRKLSALRPHVAALIREARARRLVADLLAAIDQSDEHDSRGVVFLGGHFDVECASPPALRMLRGWFDEVDGRLPHPLKHWLEAGLTNEPLRLERRDRTLVVEAPTSGALVLTEKTAPPASLTPREIEVLRALADGKSTAEIARKLWVTPATVSKHLEHIYRKLGVTSRTAAVAAVSARCDWLSANGP